MKKSSKRKLVILVIIALVVLAAVLFVTMRKPPAPSYATEAVHRGNIENTVLANGMLQAYKLVSVGAQVSGQIKNLPVTLGQQIKKGDLIAQIDSLSQQNNLKEAQASLNSINAQYRAKQAQIKQAQLEYDRQKAMLADNASSRAEYESADATLTVYQAELKQLQAQKEQAEIQVDSAKVNLGYTTISAPMDGTVVYTAVEVGQTVNANQTTPTIVEIAQLDTMTIKAQISEADVVNVHPGQEVYFTILGKPYHKYRAKLRAIEPGPTSMDGNDKDMTSSDSDAIYFNGLFDVENPDRILRIGMTAQVSIVLKQAKDVLLVPAQILVQKSGRPQNTAAKNSTPAASQPSAGEHKRPVTNNAGVNYLVPVLVNGQVQYRDVKVGINNKINAEITDGLKEGEEVIIGMPSSDSDNRFRRPPMRF
ncbi:efflux RND transporter periplasmic adaptor subunit [Shewanella dokdonensis]|uniref:Efflux RND transporter periplasmic adaptor subunit n=1 Tax=Shewanella dokdonensis TaxID=712036 RepID=A0ABX8DGP6_9GAMM|nr:efflux RND transporter periplasmic adaptor subunit [Shewanella dokdonensis]MCL1074066.1 efflux RND transporter periplasmic adaptor subunit [Shewanella dokdonensis]QVK23806.1 efflux RND transporter periplasmic adaptor subunit [Shewanella dokdonensis]